MLDSALDLLQNAALLVAIAVIYDLLPDRATQRRDRIFRVFAGLLIGVIGVLIMTAPWRAEPGIFVDTRSVLLSVTGLFFGGLPTLIAMAVMAMSRLQSGGSGAWVGLASIAATGAMGLAWRYHRRRSVSTIRTRELFLFGVAVSAVQLVLLAGLPGGAGARIVAGTLLPIMVIYPVATMLLGHLLLSRMHRDALTATLEEDEERLRLALDGARLGLYDLDLSTGRSSTNERYVEMLGEDTSSYDASTEAWLARMHPDDLPAMRAVLGEYTTGARNAHRIEFRLRRTDGSWCWILSIGRVLSDRYGGPGRLLGIHLDVTAERESEARSKEIYAERDGLLEEAMASRRALLSLVEDLRITQRTLEQSLERYSSLIRHSPDAILVNRDDRLVLVNDAFIKLMGATEESQLLGMSPYEIFDPSVHDAVRERIRVIREEGLPVPMLELRIRRLDGTVVAVEAAGSPFRDQGATAIHVVLRDITDRKRAERAIVALNADLEERVRDRTVELEDAYRELESFSYSVSHDLRAPLRAITGFSQILSRSHHDQLDETGQHYLDNISIAGERMGALIEDLLSYSRIGRREVRRDPLDVGAIADQVIATLSLRITETGARVDVETPLARPIGDATLLQQVLLNLLANAINYAREGIPPAIVIRSVRTGDQVEVSVVDNGLGIAKEHQDRVFEVFARLHSEDEIPGTGIGLAIVRKAARLMEGEIGLRSVEGEGSTFTLALPAASAEDA